LGFALPPAQPHFSIARCKRGEQSEPSDLLIFL